MENFFFSKSHPLYTSHIQRLRSKTVIPLPIGRPLKPPPPRPKHPQPVWNKTANNFSKYALTLYSPWSIESPIDLSFDGLVTYEKLLEKEARIEEATPERDISRARLSWLKNLGQGLRISNADSIAASQFRNRATTVWNAAPDGSGWLNKNQESTYDNSLITDKQKEKESEAAAEIASMLAIASQDDPVTQVQDLAATLFLESVKRSLEYIFQIDGRPSPNPRLPLDLINRIIPGENLGFKPDDLLEKLREET